MAATRENPIVFYDLVGVDGDSWSPNPYKTRLTLNFKGLPYRIEYIAFPDIEPKLKELGVAPVSDTYPRYTLPVIADPSNDPNGKPTYVSDSFKIALYLDDKYPTPKYPAIFSPGTRSLQDLLVTQYVPTIHAHIVPIIMPKMLHLLDARSAEYIQRHRSEKFKALSDDLAAQKWADAREKFVALNKSVELNDGTKDAGPFITGNVVSFIDFSLGSLIYWIGKVEGEDSPRLKEMLEWQGGRWSRHWQAIQEIENRSSRVDE
ncbi:hypothetical protein ACGC1H_002714 [Rhizoctonia solani]|uniref:GST N-terminal domain-containing protein n=1 Tax=Rhizoctonia solani TaxID=456999 RepID=A0A8H3H340_9AGAM|nr:unnamed protein product [Rhizoctonia solani]